MVKSKGTIQQNIINSGIKRNTQYSQRQDPILLAVPFNISIILLNWLNLWNINFWITQNVAVLDFFDLHTPNES